jgi:TatD DNase family protein
VLETDSPYLTPVPNRGKRNSALNIHYVAEKIADIKNIPVEEVYKATFENGKKLYRIQN